MIHLKSTSSVVINQAIIYFKDQMRGRKGDQFIIWAKSFQKSLDECIIAQSKIRAIKNTPVDDLGIQIDKK